MCKELSNRCVGRRAGVYRFLWWLFGNKIYKGEQIVPIIRDKETLFRVTDAAISFFEKHANAGERFRLTLERVGKEEFKKEVQAAYEGR